MVGAILCSLHYYYTFFFFFKFLYFRGVVLVLNLAFSRKEMEGSSICRKSEKIWKMVGRYL